MAHARHIRQVIGRSLRTIALLSVGACTALVASGCDGSLPPDEVNKPYGDVTDAPASPADPATPSLPSTPATPAAPITPTAPTTPSAPATGAGTSTCEQVMGCFEACADEACYDQCYAQGSAQAQALVDALYACEESAAAASCASQCASPDSDACWQCLESTCSAQETACFGSAGTGTSAVPSGTGSSTCQQLLMCFESCGESDYACLDSCYYQGTAAAQQQLDALDQCDEAAYTGQCSSQCTSDSDACWQCLDQACAAQLAACQ